MTTQTDTTSSRDGFTDRPDIKLGRVVSDNFLTNERDTSVLSLKFKKKVQVTNKLQCG